MPMTRALLVLLVAAATALAGCTTPGGDGGGDGGTGGNGGNGGGTGGPPVASFTVDPPEGTGQTVFTFDASVSQGTGLTYAWDFGDGRTASGPRVSHSYGHTNAVMGATLLVTDGQGRSDARVQPVKLGSGVNALPAVQLGLSALWIGLGESINATAEGTMDADGDTVTYLWGMFRHGDQAPTVPQHDHMAMDPGMAMTRESYTRTMNGFDSPVLESGATHELRLQQPGVYTYHCHPHPWMTGSVLVQAGASTQDRHLAMWQSLHFLPSSVAAAPGARLLWENQDGEDIWHTVTLSRFYPMSRAAPGGEEHAFQPDQAGVWELTLVAIDAKGGLNATSRLVQVSAEPPERSLRQNWTGEVPVAVPSANVNHTLELLHPGMATFTFNWTSPSPLAAGRLQVFPADNATAEPLLNLTAGSAQVHLKAGAYQLRVTAENAAQFAYEVVLDAVLEPTPAFAVGHEDEGGHGH